MPVPDMGLQGQHHAGFERLITGGDNLRFPLMPPGPHAMADQGHAVWVTVRTTMATQSVWSMH